MKQFFLISFLFLASITNAQKLFNNSKDFDLFNSYTKWGIQLDGLVYFPATLEESQSLQFKSQYGLGYKFGLVYNFNLTNNFGLKIGALAGQVPAINPYSMSVKTEKSMINTYDKLFITYSHNKKQTDYSPIFNYSFPILFEYRNYGIDRYILSFDGGIQIERTTGAVITETYKNYYQTKVSNPGSWDIDLIFKAGWYFQFKPIMLQTSIVYKHRLVDQYFGNFIYKDSKVTKTISGRYSQRGNYIGLSFDLYFHRRAREVEMGCRANTQSAQVRKRQERARKEKEKIRKRQEKIRKKKAKKMRKKAKKKWIFW